MGRRLHGPPGIRCQHRRLPFPNGPPNHGPDCSPPSLSAGNPINIATGNKYQSETDYAGPAIAPLLRFTRHYNSSNGLWTHNLSARLNPTEPYGHPAPGGRSDPRLHPPVRPHHLPGR
ncbi:DUF6531 domain-containing protein [Pseudomonas aeruginosa]|nr:DUF6531 domain-containing protein [Pseudomonas aeruginosa]